MPKFEESANAGKAILRMLSGEITVEQAQATIKQTMTKCAVGPHGVCQTHGQVITDCKE